MDWPGLADAVVKVGRELGLPVLGGAAVFWLAVECIRTYRAKVSK